MSNEALAAWKEFEVSDELAQTLVANKFVKPTEVQAQSLVHLQSHVDMVIAARTGQGKTLCFGIPMLELLIRRLCKAGHENDEFDSIKGFVMSPTRELAIQIKDHIQAVIPVQFASQIKIAALVGGMSIQKQLRLLSYKPTIVVATPGRVWELMSEHMNDYLLKSLPMIDVLVLDEADRMVADGHFKEMRDILAHIYTKRVEIKALQRKPKAGQEEKSTQKKVFSEAIKEQDFIIGNTVTKAGVDLSNVVDLYDEDQILEGEEEFMLSDQEEEGKEKKVKKKRLDKQLIDKVQQEDFQKDYHKLGGIQHIICSATLTIDNKGRMTPRQQKFLKKQKQKAELKGGKKSKQFEENQSASTMDDLCKIVRFRSKNPKIIDLTEEERMPDTLVEKVVRCKKEEKDLYMFYYLSSKIGESSIIFCNSITCTKRVSSILDFMKIKNQILHSKMQQRQRLKNLDRFKAAVQKIESKPVELGEASKDKKNDDEPAILVCTDVAARGLDIPNVQNVLHYQSPFNAEIYVHRSGRTARIGRSGESLALLAPEDEKNYQIICKVLKSSMDSIQMLDVKYAKLELMRPAVNAAIESEKTFHRENADAKAASWVLKTAKEADLALDEDLKFEIEEKLGTLSGKKRARSAVDDDEELTGAETPLFKQYDDLKQGSRNKEQQRSQALKQSYEKNKTSQLQKRFGKCSFLTPESITYLNESIKKRTSKLDEELVYAGLHSENVKGLKFKRTEKNKQRFKGRQKRSQKKRNRASNS